MSESRLLHASAADRTKPIALTRALPFALFATATVLSAYLAWISFRGETVAGCGIGSSCGELLNTPWAYWLGIPVSVPAIVLYLTLAVGAWRRSSVVHPVGKQAGSPWLPALAGVVIGAALWFVVLQVTVIRAICVFCLTTHLLGSAGAVLVVLNARRCSVSGRLVANRVVLRAVSAGILGVGVLAAGQLVLPKKAQGVSAHVASNESSEAEAVGRVLSLHDGRINLDLAAVPTIGTAAAPYIAVSLFDYTCSHCRSMHQLLEHAQRDLGGRLSVVMMPMPLDAACNRLVRQTSPENANACTYARLSLAVWLAKPDAFPEFHSWLFTPPRPPSVEDARHQAERIMGATLLQETLGSDRISQQLKLGVDLFAINSRRAGVSQLPQLILGNRVSVGAIRNRETLLLMLKDAFGEIGDRTLSGR